LAEWTATKEEETQEKEKEEEASIEEVVTPPDEGELLLVKRVLFGFQRIEEEPKEDPFNIPEEKAIISTPKIPSKVPPTSPRNKPIQLTPFHTFNEPSLRVSKLFKEWKFIVQAEWKV